jgi:anti-sigma factor RsiW
MPTMQVSLWRKIDMHRDHRWAQSRMSEYVDGELSDRSSRRLAAHSSICPECHRVLLTLRRMVSALGQVGRPKPPPADRIADNVLKRIRSEPAE